MTAQVQMRLKDEQGVLYGVTFNIPHSCYGESKSVHVQIVGQETSRGIRSVLEEGKKYSLEEVGRELLGKAISRGGSKSTIDITITECP